MVVTGAPRKRLVGKPARGFESHPSPATLSLQIVDSKRLPGAEALLTPHFTYHLEPEPTGYPERSADTDSEVRTHETTATRVIDLGGRTVVAVREAAPGAVVVTNPDWHEAQLAEQRLPLRRDLDAVAPDHPVVVVRGGHEYVLNSAGLARWGITADTPVPAGGEISRYDDGSLNGELIDAAKNLVSLDPPPPRDFETRIADQLAEHARLHAAGLTSIRHPGVRPPSTSCCPS